MKRIVLSAAYGMGNVGDEAICTVAVRDILAVLPDASVTVLAWDPALWRSMHPELAHESRVQVRRAFFLLSQLKSPAALVGIAWAVWSILRCDVFLWGGGGIIRDRVHWLRAYLVPLRVARALRKTILVYSIGVHPIHNDYVRSMVRYLAQAATVFTVRDQQSKENILQAISPLQVSIEILSDGVFHFPAVPHTPVSPIVVSLNACNWDGFRGIDERFQKFTEHLISVLRFVNGHYPFSLRGHSNNPADEKFVRYILDQLPEIKSESRTILSPEHYVLSLAECSLHIGMRMHSLILASRVQGLPFYAFSYSDKVDSLFTNADARTYLSPMDHLNIQHVQESLLQLLSGRLAPCSFAALEKDSERQRAFLQKNIA